MSIVKVARIAGVSHSTVSRVINGCLHVRPETARAVRRAMKKIKYSPPAPEKKRGPRSRRRFGIHTGNILVAWAGFPTELAATNFAQAVDGIILALEEFNLNPVFCHINETDSSPALRKIDSVDAAIIIAGEPGELFLREFHPRPVLWMSSRRTAAGDFVIAGSEAVGQLAAEYLIQRDHKRLAFLNPLPENPANNARGKGFMYRAYQNKIKVNLLTQSPNACRDTYPPSLFDLQSAVAILIQKLVKMSHPPTGLFIPQDIITAVAYPLLYSAGFVPGRDIDIISANNEPPYLIGLFPRPATIDIGSGINGRHAVQQILWRLRQPDSTPSIQVVIEPTLIPGEKFADHPYFRFPLQKGKA